MRANWTGAIVRGRDGRKGRVQNGHGNYLLVNWEDGINAYVDRKVVVMVRPPLGYTLPTAQPPARRVVFRYVMIGAALIAFASFVILLVSWFAQ